MSEAPRKKKELDPVSLGRMLGQEVKSIIKPLEARIAALENKNAKLERDCEDLLEMVDQLETKGAAIRHVECPASVRIGE